MQLVAYGAQDIYLTGNPQITFFKVVYRRHTNFSMETIEQTISGASTTAGGSGTVTISRNGDLVSSIYVTSSTNDITHGSAIVSEVELEIGGQKIDKQYEEWNDIWNELSTPASKSQGLKAMICDLGKVGGTAANNDEGVGMVQIPLNFWFCRNPGLALPLIALQYHEVKLKFKWGSTSAVGIEATCKVMCDYIYLDTDERRRFAQVSHEYLIEQIQKQSAAQSVSQKLNFNHPVKELIWTSAATNAYTTAKLKLNGHDRFSAQEEEYFQLRQPYQYHTSIPNQNLPGVAQHLGNTFLNIFSGNNQAQSSNIEAMTFAKSAVTTNKVMVSQGGTGADLTTITPSATTGAAEDETTIVFSFLKSDINIRPLPQAGDAYQIQVSGSEKRHGSTFTGNITLVHDGVLGNGDGPDATSFNIQLNGPILQSTLGAAIVDGGDLTFTDFKIINHSGASTSKMGKKINVYSFALKPEEHQPSGTCNFSRIDSAKLDTGVALSSADNIYAVNYNVLRIMSGMGGLAYSN